MTKFRPVVATLDDEAPMRKALGRLLRANGFGVESFSGGDEFLAAAAKYPPDCLLLDLQMPGRGGFDVLSILAGWPDAPPAIVITAFDEPGASERARGLGAVAYLLKPLDSRWPHCYPFRVVGAVQPGVRASGRPSAVPAARRVAESKFLSVYADKPTNGPEWGLRFGLTFVFPRS